MRLMLHLSVPLICTLSIAACTSENEKRATRDRIRETWVVLRVQAVNEQFATTARCPDDVEAGKGDRLRCTATAADGSSVIVDAVQTDDEGRLTVSTRLLETRKVETFVQDRLNTGRPPAASVSLLNCRDLVEVAKARRFTCTGIAYFKNLTLRATFTDDQGAFSYTVHPSWCLFRLGFARFDRAASAAAGSPADLTGRGSRGRMCRVMSFCRESCMRAA